MSHKETELSIKTKAKLYSLKRKFNAISDVSYAFSQLRENYKINDIETEEKAQEYIEILDNLVNEIKKAINE